MRHAISGNDWRALDGVWPDRPPRVSVIVIHFRQQAELDRTLAAVARQTYADLEVIVVDDGSPDPPSVPGGVRLLRQDDRGNRAGAARNLGARHATGDVLCFLDADTAPEPEYVTRLTRLPAIAPEVVAVGRRRYAEYDGDALARELPGPAWLTQGYRDTRDLLDADDRAYRYVISAVLACSAELFAETGGFYAAFDEYGGDDWEWTYRAWLAGAALAHVPDAVAWHDGPDWSARAGADAARQATKAAEALRLADRVAVPGSRPLGVHAGRPDVVAHLPGGLSEATAFVCADSLLAALPEAAVAAPVLQRRFPRDTRLAPGDGGRVRIDVLRAVRVRGDGLRWALDGLGTEGAVELTDADDEPLLRLVTSRAAARATRWKRPIAFERRAIAGLDPIEGEPDVEGYLGGWA